MNSKILSDSLLPMGIFLLTELFLSFLLATLGFHAGMPVNAYIVPVAMVLAAAVTRWLDGDNRRTLTAITLGLSVMAISAVVNLFIYDVVFDSILYHSQSVAMMGEGWNPFSEFAPNHSRWSTHYAKALEVMQATMLALTGNIQAARCVNVIFAVAALALAWEAMRIRFRSVTRKWRILLLTLIAINPIVIWQLPTTYNDFALWIETVVLLSGFFLAWHRPERPTGYVVIFIIVGIAVNTKFTHFFYIGLECLILALWAVSYRKWMILRKGVAAVMAAVIIGVFVLGFNPYVTNTVGFGHPFYPIGDGTYDLALVNSQPIFSSNCHLVNFVKSLLSVKDSPWAYATGNFSIDGIMCCYGGGMFVNGFGIFMFPMLICSFLLMAVSRCNLREWLIYLTVFGCCLFFDQSWWARYIPFLWLALVIPIITSFLHRGRPRIQAWLRNAIMVMAIVNAAASVAATAYSHISCSLFYDYVFTTQRRIGKPIEIAHIRPLTRQQLRERGVEYIVYDSIQLIPDAEGQLFRTYGLDYFITVMKLPSDDYPELYGTPQTLRQKIGRFSRRRIEPDELQP